MILCYKQTAGYFLVSKQILLAEMIIFTGYFKMLMSHAFNQTGQEVSGREKWGGIAGWLEPRLALGHYNDSTVM